MLKISEGTEETLERKKARNLSCAQKIMT